MSKVGSEQRILSSAERHQMIPAHHVVVISGSTCGSTHSPDKERIKLSYDTVQIPEKEDDNVSVIRKYKD